MELYMQLYEKIKSFRSQETREQTSRQNMKLFNERLTRKIPYTKISIYKI